MQHVWQPCGKWLHKKYIAHTVKHPPVQMDWGPMSAAGTTVVYNLASVKTINRQKMYQIKKKLEMRIFVDQCNIFMHDGATCRKIKIELFWGENIRLLDWSRI